VVSCADFKFVDARWIVVHGKVFMTATALMLHARP
jgi:hypothetical protein